MSVTKINDYLLECDLCSTSEVVECLQNQSALDTAFPHQWCVVYIYPDDPDARKILGRTNDESLAGVISVNALLCLRCQQRKIDEAQAKNGKRESV